jgi:hypothetical protein
MGIFSSKDSDKYKKLKLTCDYKSALIIKNNLLINGQRESIIVLTSNISILKDTVKSSRENLHKIELINAKNSHKINECQKKLIHQIKENVKLKRELHQQRI